MLTPAYTRQFERDTERMKKRWKNLEKLKIIIRSVLLGFRLRRHICDYFYDSHVIKTRCYPMKLPVFAQKL